MMTRKYLSFVLVLFSMSWAFSLPSLALVIDRAEMNLADPDQKLANLAILKFEGQLGMRLNIPVIVQNSHRSIDAGLQSTLTELNTTSAFAMATSVSINSEQKWTLNDALPVEKCLILLTAPGYLSAGITRKSIIAHEAFHCFQYQMAGSFNAAATKPKWLLEGSAMFAGEDFVDESTPNFGEGYLTKYVSEVQTLFRRSYDAFPFFLHLKKEGIKVYPLINSLMSANITQFDLWQTIVNAVPHTALISWAASFTRASDWGRDWDLKVNNFLPDPIYNLPIQQSSTASLPLSFVGEMGLPRHDEIQLIENKIVKLSIQNGVGAIHYYPEGFPNGRTLRLQEGENIQFCMGQQCDCPDAASAIRTLKVDFDRVLIASVGTRDKQIVKLEDGELHCCQNTGLFDARMVGTWSTGIENLLAAWDAWPRTGSHRESSGTGTVEIKISSQGNIVKSYHDVQFNSTTTTGRDTATEQLNLNYDISGCLTTRPINPNKGWFFVSDLMDMNEWTLQTQSSASHPIVTRNGISDWYEYSLCVAGTHGCMSNYYFEGDRLRILGASVNGMYTDLVKISD